MKHASAKIVTDIARYDSDVIALAIFFNEVEVVYPFRKGEARMSAVLRCMAEIFERQEDRLEKLK